MKQNVEIKGARIHNLRNVDVTIPKNKLTVITGVSGSGKSSLAFDTLYELRIQELVVKLLPKLKICIWMIYWSFYRSFQ